MELDNVFNAEAALPDSEFEAEQGLYTDTMETNSSKPCTEQATTQSLHKKTQKVDHTEGNKLNYEAIQQKNAQGELTYTPTQQRNKKRKGNRKKNKLPKINQEFIQSILIQLTNCLVITGS